MITYRKHFCGIPLLFHGFYGSSFFRALPFPIASTLFAIFLFYERPVELPTGSGRPGVENESGFATAAYRAPYPFQVFAFIVGFMIVYRTNYSYNRWWEARASIQMMAAKWADVFIFSASWDASANPSGKMEEEGIAFRQRLLHLVSLLHSVAMMGLRGDRNLSNLGSHHSAHKIPHFTGYLSGGPLCCPGEHKWNKARGWSNVFALSERKRKTYHQNTPIPVIGGISSLELDVLHSVESPSLAKVEKHIEDTRPYTNTPILEEAGSVTQQIDELVSFVQSQVHWLIVKRRLEGGINVSAPEVSRIWQVLTDGTLGYMQARKIVDTPFPFPHAQLIIMALVLFAFFCPTIMVAYISEPWLMITLNFMTTWIYFGVNEVCRELEDPFTYDPNDLPLTQLAHEFNERLMACMHGIRVNLYHNHNECTSVLCTFREKAYLAPGEGTKPPVTPKSFNLASINEVPSQVSAAPVVSNQMEAGGSQEGGDEKSPEANRGLFGGIVEQASDGDWDGEEETEPEGEDIIAPLKSKTRSYLKETGSTSPKSVLRGRFGKQMSMRTIVQREILEREGRIEDQNLVVTDDFERGTDYRPPVSSNLQAQIRAQRAQMERDPHYDAPNLSLKQPEARPFEAPKRPQNFLHESSARPMPVERKSFDIQSSHLAQDRRSLTSATSRKKTVSGIW